MESFTKANKFYKVRFLPGAKRDDEQQKQRKSGEKMKRRIEEEEKEKNEGFLYCW
jgi:hypothetical protein